MATDGVTGNGTGSGMDGKGNAVAGTAEVTPPYDLPGDCHHSLHRYDCETRRLGYRCGVGEDGVPLLVGDEEEPKDIASDGSDCVDCPFFEDTRIRYPLTVSGIDVEELDDAMVAGRDAPGTIVLVSFLEGDEKLRRMGILVGNLPVAPIVSYDKDDGTLSVRPLTNPAIFVPSVGRIVWGCESWWHPTTLDDLEQVVGDDPWQMGIARAMLAERDGEADG